MKHPQVIFLDAVGTLFGACGTIGEIYGEIAQPFGVQASTTALNKAFFKSFAAAPPMAFPAAAITEIPALEFEWWQDITRRTFESVGVLQQFSDFPQFFQKLYTHFTTATPWFVYPDVKPTLLKWRQQGIELGVLSNFDSRLYAVLQALELTEFFTSITLSTEVGVAKPNPQIFAIALQKHDCHPETVLHIGDSYEADYQGALAAGIKAIWLNREPHQQFPEVPQCTTLEHLNW